MNDAKHEITVYDRVPSTASVSVAQVEAYLRRTGWIVWSPTQPGWWSNGAWAVHVYDTLVSDDEIERVAAAERRQPSAVLADIAREPV
jgi:hypothetical protein